jgi:hypothetical protein
MKGVIDMIDCGHLKNSITLAILCVDCDSVDFDFDVCDIFKDGDSVIVECTEHELVDSRADKDYLIGWLNAVHKLDVKEVLFKKPTH